MRTRFAVATLACALMTSPASAQTPPRPFSVASADGTMINGQADLPERRTRAAVVFVAGTGLFDRDARFGASGTPRDLVFADLAQRITARGVAAVRYDRRGVRHGAAPAEMLDVSVSGTSTVETQRDDLAAVYNWARARDGLNARCIVLFGHSEGLLHISRLAASGARAPTAVIGLGGLLESPLTIMRWQAAERDHDSLLMMDVDGDGRVTNAEVEANWRRTPSSFVNTPAPFIQPDGKWTAEEVAMVATFQRQSYEAARTQVLAASGDGVYPNEQTPMARYSWWQSWFVDDVSAASQLAHWRVPMIFHYGTTDSQTP